MRASIQKRTGVRGVSWQVIIELPRDPNTGKRRQKWLTVPTKREADALAAKYVTAIENGGYAEADAGKMTLEQYMARWLDAINQSVRPSTHRRYADLAAKHIIPIIGKIRLAKLSALDIQRLYANRLAAGLSPTSVELLHCVLHRALKQAVKWALLQRNVAEAVEAPKRNTPERKAWNAQEARAFLALSDRHEYAALWRLALSTGMRRGELLGLKWQDIDLARTTLSVRRSLSRGNAGSFEFGEPKTAAGRRAITLTTSEVESLKAHRVRQVEARLQVGSVYTDLDLVFADALGLPLHPNTVRWHFRKLIAKAGVRYIRIHDLRHTSATLMMEMGIAARVVQERLGHANISMTLGLYSHVTPTMQQQAADKLQELLGG